MITEHIELPDPVKYSSNVVWYFDNQKYRIVAYQRNDTHGNWPNVLALANTAEEAADIVDEMRIRMRVAASLLGLK